MTRLIPYPLLALALLVMWLLLNSFSLGHVVLGSVVAIAASRAMVALQPSKTRLNRWQKIPALFVVVMGDILRSNLNVSAIVLRGRRRAVTPGFVTIPLDLRDPTGLAVLAIIITSTPGTAWIEHNEAAGSVRIHVLDLDDEQALVDLVKQRYERPLMEIFT